MRARTPRHTRNTFAPLAVDGKADDLLVNQPEMQRGKISVWKSSARVSMETFVLFSGKALEAFHLAFHLLFCSSVDVLLTETVCAVW